jgi:hypothetical protein
MARAAPELEPENVFPMEYIIKYIQPMSSDAADALTRTHEYWLNALKKGTPPTYKKVKGARDPFPIWGKEPPEEDAEKVRKFCLENSGFAQAVWNNGRGSIYENSWGGLRHAYDDTPNHPSGGSPELDYVFLHAPAPVDVRNRRHQATELVTSLARKLVREGHSKFIIDNLGSGDGDDTLAVLERLYEEGILLGKDGVYARCFDKRKRVLREGESDLKESCIPDDAMEFIHTDLTKPGLLENLPKSMISIILGGVDYFSDENAPQFISYCNTPLVHGGYSVTSNIRPHSFGNQAFMGMHGWYTQERMNGQYEGILERAGLSDIEIVHTPLKIFMIGYGRKV